MSAVLASPGTVVILPFIIYIRNGWGKVLPGVTVLAGSELLSDSLITAVSCQAAALGSHRLERE